MPLSDNHVLQDFYAQIRSRLKPFRFMSLSHPTSLTLSLAEYQDSVAGLEHRDAARVEEALQRKERCAIARLLATREAPSRAVA